MTPDCIEFGSERFWREWPLYGYAGKVHHIIQMAEEHYITTRKAAELIEFAVRFDSASSLPELPLAPWKEYLARTNEEVSPEKKD